MFTDFIGQPLAVGDRVVHGVGGRRGGLTGPYYVHSFTAAMVRTVRRRADLPEPAREVATAVSPHCLVKVPA